MSNSIGRSGDQISQLKSKKTTFLPNPVLKNLNGIQGILQWHFIFIQLLVFSLSNLIIFQMSPVLNPEFQFELNFWKVALPGAAGWLVGEWATYTTWIFPTKSKSRQMQGERWKRQMQERNTNVSLLVARSWRVCIYTWFEEPTEGNMIIYRGK